MLSGMNSGCISAPYAKYLDRHIWENIVNPDDTATEKEFWSSDPVFDILPTLLTLVRRSRIMPCICK